MIHSEICAVPAERHSCLHGCCIDGWRSSTPSYSCPRPVTNQVTTRSAHASRCGIWADGKHVLICVVLTNADHARRIRQAWHARGQGFESP